MGKLNFSKMKSEFYTPLEEELDIATRADLARESAKTFSVLGINTKEIGVKVRLSRVISWRIHLSSIVLSFEVMSEIRT